VYLNGLREHSGIRIPKLSLWLAKHPTMQTYRGVEVQLHVFLNLGLGRGPALQKFGGLCVSTVVMLISASIMYYNLEEHEEEEKRLRKKRKLI
jgi:purine-cytosine permease-like protein